MSYGDVNTSLDDLTAPFPDLPEEIRNTLYDYDPSGEKNIWKQFEANKNLMSNQLRQANAKASTLGAGFSGMGARSTAKDTTSQMYNDNFGGMLDNSMYQEYKMKTDWKEAQLGTIADAIIDGDVGGDEDVPPSDYFNCGDGTFAPTEEDCGNFDEGEGCQPTYNMLGQCTSCCG